jgi:8-oxo-dGTP diphosphatase
MTVVKDETRENDAPGEEVPAPTPSSRDVANHNILFVTPPEGFALLESFVVNVEIVVVRDDRYLMIVRGDGEDFGAGWLTFPGGKLDWDEAQPDALEATARRELLEEVGVDLVPPVTYVESHTFAVGEIKVLDVVFVARAGEGEPSIRDPAEVAGLAWLSGDEIMADSRVQPWTHESLRRVVARRQQHDDR